MKKEILGVLGVLNTVLYFLKNKAVAIVLLGYGTISYDQLIDWMERHPEAHVPFVETFYATLMIGAVAILAPLLRLLVFPEAAAYAEKGGLKVDLEQGLGGLSKPPFVHYWRATALCYAVVALCLYGAR